MEHNYEVLIEYLEYDRNMYPNELVSKLVSKGICRVQKNIIKFIATGFIIYKNRYIIIFPKAYPLPNSKKLILNHIRLLFKVLLKYRQEANLETEEIELMGGKEGKHRENLFTAYHLIKDFTINGLLTRELTFNSSRQSGRIDWTATINKKQPVFSQGNVIYTETISRKTSIDSQNKLYLLHKYCIYKSIYKYGWLFGLDLEGANLNPPELNFNISFAINLLKNELNSTFVEREINVIKMMIDFLKGLEAEKTEEKLETLITPYFQNVWEYICSIIFNNQYNNLKDIIPKLRWEIESDAPVQSQRPDILVLQDKKMYILDAKYYNIRTNLPGWYDVVKQLFYAFTIIRNIKSENFTLRNKNLEKKLRKIDNIENIFLFPSEESEPIKYVGKVNIENNEDFKDIKAYKINTYFAMKCFIGEKKYNFLEQL